MKTELPIALSNKHCHLSQEDVEKLFGEGYTLTKKKDLKQPGQYACEEMIEVVGEKGSIKMRVLGPVRKESQVEILSADAFKLGVPITIRESGKLEGTPGIKLVGPKGEITLDKGVIVAARHVHMSDEQAKEYSVKDRDVISVKVEGERGLVFDNILVRAGKQHTLEIHVDTEEGNAAGCKNNQMVKIVNIISN